MVHKGNHHCQAVCACATHLLDRVRAVLRDGRPYELRDGDDPVRAKTAELRVGKNKNAYCQSTVGQMISLVLLASGSLTQ
jgi:hypothetical protein